MPEGHEEISMEKDLSRNGRKVSITCPKASDTSMRVMGSVEESCTCLSAGFGKISMVELGVSISPMAAEPLSMLMGSVQEDHSGIYDGHT